LGRREDSDQHQKNTCGKARTKRAVPMRQITIGKVRTRHMELTK